MTTKRVQVCYNASAEEVEAWRSAAAAVGSTMAKWLRKVANESAAAQARRIKRRSARVDLGARIDRVMDEHGL